MMIDEAEVSWLREGFAQPDEAPNPDNCPPPDRILSAVQGKLSRAEVCDVIEHTVVCAPCAEEWRLATAIPESAATAQGARPRLRDRRAFVGLLAASLVAAVIGGPRLWEIINPNPSRSGQEPISSENKDTLPRSQFLLRWTPVPEALSYDIDVFTALSKTVVQQEKFAKNEYLVPESALRSFPAGSTVFWTVTANLPAGNRQSSLTFETRIR